MNLVNFRNYESLRLELEPGLVLIEGGNGQGKSNLLEAIYMLSIAKTPRAGVERELIRRQPMETEVYTQVSAAVHRGSEQSQVRIDFRSTLPQDTREDSESSKTRRSTASDKINVQKFIRVNGVPRRALELVGHLNAVMFCADDLELVYGSPSVRRRYLDILVSQFDRQYLRTLQSYQRVVTQRNHLLKSLREGRARVGELDFWDDELTTKAAYITSRRIETLAALSELARPTHEDLTGNGERLELIYQPTVPFDADASEDERAEQLKEALRSAQPREIAQGMTLHGPHRDDLQLLIDDMDAGTFASRGQSRTIVMAMKLAEARHLQDRRGQQPILLLDDVLSELDATRRVRILEQALQYEQVFVTTADVGSIDQRFLHRSHRFVVQQVRVEPVDAETNES